MCSVCSDREQGQGTSYKAGAMCEGRKGWRRSDQQTTYAPIQATWFLIGSRDIDTMWSQGPCSRELGLCLLYIYKPVVRNEVTICLSNPLLCTSLFTDVPEPMVHQCHFLFSHVFPE